MTEQQQNAVRIVLSQCAEKKMDVDDALDVIDAIIGSQQIQYVPWTTDLKPTYEVNWPKPDFSHITCNLKPDES